jgi:hypothetical protein
MLTASLKSFFLFVTTYTMVIQIKKNQLEKYFVIK